jgi:hypothetical protein
MTARGDEHDPQQNSAPFAGLQNWGELRSTKNILTAGLVVAGLILLNIVTTSLGDESSRLTIVNKTGAYIHIYIEGTTYPYVAPDRSVTHSASARETFYVETFYSPGQNISANIVDSTFTLPYTPAQTYTTGDNCSCEDPNSSVSCTDDEGVVTNPAQGGSANWEITRDLFDEN